MATAPTTALDNTDEHSTTALYRAAIGDISNGYYLPRFTRFEAADQPGLSWNWAAALNTLNWLMFRQLWHAALVYSGSIVALALLLFGIGKLVFQFSEGTQWGLLAALVGLAFAVPGLGGNALYYLATRQRVQNALAKNQTVPEACAQLSKQASTRKGLIIIAACNLAVAAITAQSYAMFSGFEPLPAGTPVAVSAAPEGRNVASGRAVDATAAASAKASASVPSVASSAAAPASSTATPAAPATSSAVIAAKPPTEAASSPAAKPGQTAASAPAPAASTPARLPAAAASATAAKAPVSAAAPAVANKPATSASAVTPVRPAPSTAASAPAPAPAKSSVEKAAPKPSGTAPVALRSAAAESAAHEVAASLGQSAPVAPATLRTAVIAPAETLAAGRFVVNVGLFADANNARNALVKLMDAELPVVSKEIRFPKGNRTRVQVGPFDTLAEADAAADKVRALELEARVAPLP
ncbi:SPOR domain-containing protein [Rhodoferax mekongensis]|uniref:SPOR domain-containing protein n=1 Tax=Rhodoferax mekongensis TaxID=3068341 RepID=UPI0028BD889F|nr:SPOR domain-containing protein [Rhodoferax sp. TBRC 17199]MDT7515095.1 SPOR domain-containing protein [Rhodoferax sp. TBRC 17199]